MKTMKKLTALVVAFVMVLAMTVTAFAADTTITAPSNGHTYKAYQIFTGDLAEDGKTLSNLAWGTSAKDTSIAIDAAVEALTAVNSKTDSEILAVIENYVDLTKGAITLDGETKVATGYYVIVDEAYDADDTEDADKAYSLNIVEIVGPTEITPKADVPEFEKKVDDKDDSTTTEDTIVWEDSADYDIGDAVPFQLKATIASNYADYETYYLNFHDVESTGLTFNNDVKVYVDGNEIETGFEVVTDCEDGCTFEVIINECKDIAAIGANSVVTVEYTSTLNDDAVIGEVGNPNTAKLEYSNNPNNKQDGDKKPETEETPDDTVIVFTYKGVANKVDENGDPLTGAAFELFKKVTTTAEIPEGITPVADDNGVLWISLGEKSGEEMTTFEWAGIDAGEYKIVETKTPDGYNSIDDQYFTVAATHSDKADEPKLLTLTGTPADGSVIEMTAAVEKGTVSTDIVNKSGATLPTTGGMGTTVIYAIGAILVLGAGVLLITRRRIAK